MWCASLSHPIYAPLAPWRGLGRSLDALNRAAADADIRTESGRAIRFIAPTGARGPYELRVHETGRIETRDDNLHDWFNALCWLAFPRTWWALLPRALRHLSPGALLPDLRRPVVPGGRSPPASGGTAVHD